MMCVIHTKVPSTNTKPDGAQKGILMPSMLSDEVCGLLHVTAGICKTSPASVWLCVPTCSSHSCIVGHYDWPPGAG